MIFYAFCLCLAFLVLVAGVVSSVRIIFIIYVGIDHSLALPLIENYGYDSHATATWDNLQGTFKGWAWLGLTLSSYVLFFRERPQKFRQWMKGMAVAEKSVSANGLLGLFGLNMDVALLEKLTSMRR